MTESHDDQPITPGSRKDWHWDWRSWLANGDSIASRTLAVSAPLTAVSTTLYGGIVSAEIACPPEAAVGARLRATCTVTTAGGLTESRSIRFVVRPR